MIKQQQQQVGQRQREMKKAQEKGLLLARLLEKAVQDKRKTINNNNNTATTTNNINSSITFDNNLPSIPANTANSTSTQDFQRISSSLSLTTISNGCQQISQMLKCIYVQVFDEQKYYSDNSKYEEIETNLSEYNIVQEFNKEGRMLENVVNEVRRMKYQIYKLQTQLNSNSQRQKMSERSHTIQQFISTIRKLQQQNKQLTLAISMIQQQQQQWRQQQMVSRQEERVNLMFKMGKLQQQVRERDSELEMLLGTVEELELQLTKMKQRENMIVEQNITKQTLTRYQQQLSKYQSFIHQLSQQISHLSSKINYNSLHTNQPILLNQHTQTQTFFHNNDYIQQNRQQLFMQEISVSSLNLSNYSETQELNDISKLTKELSLAYDKIIHLTQEVHRLKRWAGNTGYNNGVLLKSCSPFMKAHVTLQQQLTVQLNKQMDDIVLRS